MPPRPTLSKIATRSPRSNRSRGYYGTLQRLLPSSLQLASKDPALDGSSMDSQYVRDICEGRAIHLLRALVFFRPAPPPSGASRGVARRSTVAARHFHGRKVDANKTFRDAERCPPDVLGGGVGLGTRFLLGSTIPTLASGMVGAFAQCARRPWMRYRRATLLRGISVLAHDAFDDRSVDTHPR